ncbi:MAG: trypsin-like serine protease [Geobacteraceae bacterium]|nr:trypsin-like serine protease [Geobacteraceae bacterium]
MVKLRPVIFLSALLVIGWHAVSYPMVGGTVVGNGDTFKKHMVGIYNVADGGVCTGTLIRQDVVLTAAHCFDTSDNPEDYIALFGLAISQEKDTKSVPVAAIRIPSMYNPRKNKRNSNFDIALMKLASAAPGGYTPADVATKTDGFPVDDETYITAGYGVTKLRKNDPGILRMLAPRSAEFSLSGQGRYIELKPSGAGPCRGDSGSPLFKVARDSAGNISYSVIGVQSQAIQRAVNGKFTREFCEDVGLYTNLPIYSRWLEWSVNLPDWNAAREW